MRYPVESFTPEEEAVLRPHFTNLDLPVFCLVNLPETVKGAMFARYSRYAGTVRRLFLEEFAADVPEGERPFDGVEGERAAGLYERVFIGYGDDSIGQVGGAHLACEWVSNVLTKVLQRGRLAAYLEQSTRYIPYDQPMPGGGYRYYRDQPLGQPYEAAMDELFGIYSRSLESVQSWAAERWPRGEEPEAAWRRSIRAKALDLLRGVLPASTLSHVGIFASGQAYEQLLLRLMASPLPEAREFGGMILGRARQGDSELRGAGRASRPRRRVDRLPAGAPPGDRAHGGTARAGPPSRGRRALGRAGRRRRRRGGAARGLAVRGGGRLGGRDTAQDRGPRPARARRADRRAGRRAAEPSPPPGPRLGGGSLPVRDRLRLRRLSRPPASSDADLPVATAGAGPGRRDPGGGARRRDRPRVRAGAGDLAARVRPARGGGTRTRLPPTRSASATGSATCST